MSEAIEERKNSTNSATINFPVIHVKDDFSLFFGSSPKSIIDFKRLKYISICQRYRYVSSISDEVTSLGSEVATIIYLTSSEIKFKQRTSEKYSSKWLVLWR